METPDTYYEIEFFQEGKDHQIYGPYITYEEAAKLAMWFLPDAFGLTDGTLLVKEMSVIGCLKETVSVRLSIKL